MVELTVIVPLRDNAGVSLQRERRAVERELLALAGGYTRDKVSGAWLDKASGKVYRDESYRYTLAVQTPLMAVYVEHRASEWASLLRQECVFVSRREVEVTFAEPRQKAS